MLRRTAASHMLGNGVYVATVMEYCGWGSLGVVQSYAASDPERRRAAADGLANM